jgi:hypothetical protein
MNIGNSEATFCDRGQAEISRDRPKRGLDRWKGKNDPLQQRSPQELEAPIEEGIGKC